MKIVMIFSTISDENPVVPQSYHWKYTNSKINFRLAWYFHATHLFVNLWLNTGNKVIKHTQWKQERSVVYYRLYSVHKHERPPNAHTTLSSAYTIHLTNVLFCCLCERTALIFGTLSLLWMCCVHIFLENLHAHMHNIQIPAGIHFRETHHTF